MRYRFPQRVKPFGSAVLAGIVAIALVCGVALPGQTQATSQEQENLLEEIRQVAEADAQDPDFSLDQGIPIMVDAYLEDAEQVGLSRRKILQEYKQAYRQAKPEALADDPFDALMPDLGWIVAAIVAALAILWNVAKEWISTAVKRIGNRIFRDLDDWIFEHILGWTPFGWSKSLELYRGKLIEKHNQLKFPFRPNLRWICLMPTYRCSWRMRQMWVRQIQIW